MTSCLSASLGLLLAAQIPVPAAPEPADPAVEAELQRLQGTWQLESMERGGEKAPVEADGRTFFVGGRAFLGKREDGLPFQSGTLKVDPSKSPKAISAAIAQGEGEGAFMLGIYELDGDVLKLCFDPDGEERPTGFATEEGSRRFLAVYRRVKPRADEGPEIVGRYQSESPGPAGKQVAVAILERQGDGYRMTYKVGMATAYIGIGIRRGDTLSVCFMGQNSAGVTVYQIEDRPGQGLRLVGQYTQLGGIGLLVEEILTHEAEDVPADRFTARDPAATGPR